MGKLKILLLWWIFTLLWLFNFSNASNITFNGVDRTYSPSTVTFNSDFIASDFDSFCYIDYIENIEDHDQEDCLIELLNNDDHNIQFWYSKWIECENWECSIVVYDDFFWLDIPSWTYSVLTDWDIAFSSFTLYDVPIDLWWNEWWNEWWNDFILGWYSALTPAIDSLKGTVYQIIPFVVYISIWLLLSIIWFYAIRWLVNWLWIKINSVFKSKRW